MNLRRFFTDSSTALGMTIWGRQGDMYFVAVCGEVVIIAIDLI